MKIFENWLKSTKQIIRQSTESEDDFEYHWVQIQLKNVKKLSLSCRKGVTQILTLCNLHFFNIGELSVFQIVFYRT